MAQTKVRQFAGDIRFWQRGSNGALTPVIPEPADPDLNQPLETNSLVFGYEAGEEQNVISKRRGARYQQPVLRSQLPGTTTVTAQLLEVPTLMLASMLFGQSSTATVTAGSITDSPVAVTRVDAPIQLPYRKLAASPAPVVKIGATTLVAGTDYKIDLRRGQLTPVGAAIEVGDTLLITASYDAHVSVTIEGGAVPTRDFYITGDMEDRISGESGELRIPQATLGVDGEVDWLSDQPIQVTLTGACVVADGESAPYTFVNYT
jgi:hypothetical protein